MQRTIDPLLYLLLSALILFAAWQGIQLTEQRSNTYVLAADTKDLRAEREALRAKESRTAAHLPTTLQRLYVFEVDTTIPLSPDLQRHAWELCRQNNIPYNVFMRLMWRESRYQTDAINLNTNGTYDRSLMQINDCNRAWLADHYSLDTSDPYDSIEAAVVLLAGYLQWYDQVHALAAYGVGETGMLAGRGIGAARKLLEDSGQLEV